MPSNDERLAVVENEVKTLKEQQAEILALQRAFSDQLTRYKGFIGGVVFLGSCVWALVTIGKDILMMKLGIK